MSQKPMPTPHPGPKLEWKDRYELTQKHISEAKPLPTPPPGFEPLKATDEELTKAGLPRRPNPETQPAMYAKWKAIMGRPLQHVRSTFTAIPWARDTLPRDAKVGKPASGAGPAANSTSGNWSGAAVFGLAAGDSYKSVSASWTVPNAYPPDSAKLPSGDWVDGTYLCVSWVGIDGWGSGDVLQAGTGTQCVVSLGKITSQSAFAWYEWYPFSWVTFDSFAVQPGDTVNCLVCCPDGAGGTTGWAFLHNTSTGQYTNVAIVAPPATATTPATTLVGNCAEWIMEDPSVGGAPAPFPDYGAEFFYDCAAGTATGAQVDLTNCYPIDLVQGGVTLSTAVDETKTVLMTYASGSGP